MKRILVTGGAGFIGSHLCERLVNEGHDVICLVMTCANPIGQKWMKSTIWLVQLRRFTISMTQYRPLGLVSSEHTPEDAQAKIDGSRVEGKHLPFYLKLFVDSLSSRNVYHMVGKLFENTRLSSFVDLCEIASRYVLAKAKMIGLVGMRRNNIGQITKAVTVAQLPEHHDEQLVPACEMLHVFVSFVFHYNSIKDSLWQELYELSEDIFSSVHRMTDLLLDCKGSQFKSSPSIFCSKTLYLSNLQTFPLFFSGH